jgi:hypothetical protein
MTSTLRILTACAAVALVTGPAAAMAPFPGGGGHGNLGLDSAVASRAVNDVAGSLDAVASVEADRAAPALTTAPPAGVYSPSTAEFLSRAEGPWVVVAPYAWIFGIHGEVGAGRRVQTVDLSVADAFDGAVNDLEGAAQLHVEAGYGDFGVIADLTYLRVVPLDRAVRVESESTIFELLGMYRVCGSGCRRAGDVFFDVLAGARYYRFSNSIQLTSLEITPVDRENSWIDLIVGARAGVQVLDCLGVWVRGDIGGFGIGHASRRACNVIAGFEYQCSECCSFLAGYRWLKIDRSAGIGRDAFLLDATLAGPFVAFGLRF